jgi:K+-sensing histidine kinase KdpD
MNVSGQDRTVALVGMVVHDARNALSAAVANVEFAARALPGDTAMVVDALADAEDALRRMRTLLDDVVTVAQLDGMVPQRSSIELGALVDEVFQEEARAAQLREVGLKYEAPRHVPIVGDRTLVRRTLSIALESSLARASRESDVIVRASTENGQAFVDFITDAPAPPKGTAATMFDEHGQQVAAQAGFGNVGVRLYLLRRIVEAHGGRVTLGAHGGVRMELPGSA